MDNNDNYCEGIFNSKDAPVGHHLYAILFMTAEGATDETTVWVRHDETIGEALNRSQTIREMYGDDLAVLDYDLRF